MVSLKDVQKSIQWLLKQNGKSEQFYHESLFELSVDIAALIEQERKNK